MLFGFISQRVSGVREVYVSTVPFTSLVGSSYQLPGGGGIMPVMAYTGRLRPRGASFFNLGFRYTKGEGFH